MIIHSMCINHQKMMKPKEILAITNSIHNAVKAFKSGMSPSDTMLVSLEKVFDSISSNIELESFIPFVRACIIAYMYNNDKDISKEFPKIIKWASMNITDLFKIIIDHNGVKIQNDNRYVLILCDASGSMGNDGFNIVNNEIKGFVNLLIDLKLKPLIIHFGDLHTPSKFGGLMNANTFLAWKKTSDLGGSTDLLTALNIAVNKIIQSRLNLVSIFIATDGAVDAFRNINLTLPSTVQSICFSLYPKNALSDIMNSHCETLAALVSNHAKILNTTSFDSMQLKNEYAKISPDGFSNKSVITAFGYKVPSFFLSTEIMNNYINSLIRKKNINDITELFTFIRNIFSTFANSFMQHPVIALQGDGVEIISLFTSVSSIARRISTKGTNEDLNAICASLADSLSMEPLYNSLEDPRWKKPFANTTITIKQKVIDMLRNLRQTDESSQLLKPTVFFLRFEDTKVNLDTRLLSSLSIMPTNPDVHKEVTKFLYYFQNNIVKKKGDLNILLKEGYLPIYFDDLTRSIRLAPLALGGKVTLSYSAAQILLLIMSKMEMYIDPLLSQAIITNIKKIKIKNLLPWLPTEYRFGDSYLMPTRIPAFVQLLHELGITSNGIKDMVMLDLITSFVKNITPITVKWSKPIYGGGIDSHLIMPLDLDNIAYGDFNAVSETIDKRIRDGDRQMMAFCHRVQLFRHFQHNKVSRKEQMVNIDLIIEAALNLPAYPTSKDIAMLDLLRNKIGGKRIIDMETKTTVVKPDDIMRIILNDDISKEAKGYLYLAWHMEKIKHENSEIYNFSSYYLGNLAILLDNLEMKEAWEKIFSNDEFQKIYNMSSVSTRQFFGSLRNIDVNNITDMCINFYKNNCKEDNPKFMFEMEEAAVFSSVKSYSKRISEKFESLHYMSDMILNHCKPMRKTVVSDNIEIFENDDQGDKIISLFSAQEENIDYPLCPLLQETLGFEDGKFVGVVGDSSTIFKDKCQLYTKSAFLNAWIMNGRSSPLTRNNFVLIHPNPNGDSMQKFVSSVNDIMKNVTIDEE